MVLVDQYPSDVLAFYKIGRVPPLDLFLRVGERFANDLPDLIGDGPHFGVCFLKKLVNCEARTPAHELVEPVIGYKQRRGEPQVRGRRLVWSRLQTSSEEASGGAGCQQSVSGPLEIAGSNPADPILPSMKGWRFC